MDATLPVEASSSAGGPAPLEVPQIPPAQDLEHGTSEGAELTILPDPEATVHSGVSCDGETCRELPHRGIKGIRYECTVCKNKNFGSACEPDRDVGHPRLMHRTPASRTSRPIPSLAHRSRFPRLLSSMSTVGASPGSTDADTGGGLPPNDARETSAYAALMRRLRSECTGGEKSLLGCVADLSKFTIC